MPELGLRVEYGPSGVVCFIDADLDAAPVSLAGMALSGAAAPAVVAHVAHVAQAAGLAPADFPPGRHTYLFEPARVVLWREAVPDGRRRDPGFRTAAVYADGYYPPEALAYLRAGV